MNENFYDRALMIQRIILDYDAGGEGHRFQVVGADSEECAQN